MDQGLFAKYQQPIKVKKTSERGELLKYFSEKLGRPIGYVAMRLTGMDLKTLYYLKSTCDSEERRGTPWAKVWYGSIKTNDSPAST